METNAWKKDIKIIPDGQFKDTMNKEAIPFLMSIFRSGYVNVCQTLTPSANQYISSKLPHSAVSPVDDKTSVKSQRLYYESYCPSNPIGAIVISHGFCESAEKYKEVIYYFAKAGYQVYLAEHRGHARSLRETDHPNMVHVLRFTDYVDDLHTFIRKVVVPSAKGLPLYLYAHSMGGAIGALYLETYPDIFRKAILTAPMLGISMGPIPAPCVRAFGRIMVSLHKENTYSPGQHAFYPGEKFEDSCSANYERFQYYQVKKEANPLFQNSGSSYGWGYQALNACHFITQKRNCQKITVPVLVFRSAHDALVKASSIRRFVKNTPFARLITIDQSRHEIYNSSALVLEDYYREIFAFLSS